MRWVDNWHTFFTWYTSCGLYQYTMQSTCYPAALICTDYMRWEWLSTDVGIFCSVLLYNTTFAERSDTALYLETVSCYALQVVVASTVDYCWSIFQAIMKMLLTKDVICFVLIAAIFTVVSRVADCVSPAKQWDHATMWRDNDFFYKQEQAAGLWKVKLIPRANISWCLLS